MEIAILVGIVVFLLWLFLGNSSSDKTTSEKTKPTYSPRPATTAWPTPVPVVSEQERQRQEAKTLEEQKAKQAEIDRREQRRLAEIQEKQRQAAIQKQQQQIEKARQEEQRKLALLKQAQEEESKRAQEERQQKAFCEDGTSYCTSIKNIFERNPSNFQFSSIRSLSSNYGTSVFNELRSGVAQLQTYEQLSQYIFAYGLMHQAKLEQAFQVIVEGNHLQFAGQDIEIIDYGCGQGIGVVCFIDYVKRNTKFDCDIIKVRLIEPSELALKRAALNIRYALRSASKSENVYALNKGLDDILQSDLKTDSDSIKVHIFSNIIDVEDFELHALSQKIISTQTGVNLFVCVSPNIMKSRNSRLDRFQEHLVNAGSMTLISDRQSDIPNPRDGARPWRRYERIFKIHIGHGASKVPAAQKMNFSEQNDLPF